jgi:hypothetical protein
VGIAASVVAHVVVVGLLLTAPADNAIPAIEPPIVRVDMVRETSPPGEAWPEPPVEPVRPGRPARRVSEVETVAAGRVGEPLPITEPSTVSPTHGQGGAGGESVGMESRWRVAPRGRGPLPQPALKPDCSISNSDYVWPGRDRFCGQAEQAARDP